MKMKTYSMAVVIGLVVGMSNLWGIDDDNAKGRLGGYGYVSQASFFCNVEYPGSAKEAFRELRRKGVEQMMRQSGINYARTEGGYEQLGSMNQDYYLSGLECMVDRMMAHFQVIVREKNIMDANLFSELFEEKKTTIKRVIKAARGNPSKAMEAQDGIIGLREAILELEE